MGGGSKTRVVASRALWETADRFAADRTLAKRRLRLGTKPFVEMTRNEWNASCTPT